VKILITGSTGLLGQALVKRFAPPYDVVGLSRHASSPGNPGQHVLCDLTQREATQRVIRAVNADVVIHTQALSDVDRCEQEPHQADLCNRQTTEHLCTILRDTNTVLITVSTDYVFDGRKGSPYHEEDEPHPISVYGRSKLAGERATLRYPRGYVVRPSTLFGPGRMNFCNAIVQHLQRDEPIEAFMDQTTSPTYTEDLAQGLCRVVELMGREDLSRLPRVYHLANAGSCSRVEFAQCVVRLLGGNDALIRAIPMAQQRRPAPRPASSALISRYQQQVLGWSLRSWQDAVRAYLASQAWLN